MKIELSAKVHADLSLLAQAWALSEGDAVGRLIDHFRGAATAPVSTSEPVGSGPDSNLVPVHADYDGVRVTGEYDKRTQAIRILDGISARRLYKSPSGAAIAVVSELNPSVNPNRNGWGFWTITATGELLQRMRRL
jgi:hypothetical protein